MPGMAHIQQRIMAGRPVLAWIYGDLDIKLSTYSHGVVVNMSHALLAVSFFPGGFCVL